MVIKSTLKIWHMCNLKLLSFHQQENYFLHRSKVIRTADELDEFNTFLYRLTKPNDFCFTLPYHVPGKKKQRPRQRFESEKLKTAQSATPHPQLTLFGTSPLPGFATLEICLLLIRVRHSDYAHTHTCSPCGENEKNEDTLLIKTKQQEQPEREREKCLLTSCEKILTENRAKKHEGVKFLSPAKKKKIIAHFTIRRYLFLISIKRRIDILVSQF